jgi:DNA-binding protein H-NS
MATQTYAQLQSQIAKLTADAQKLKAAEIANVVSRIKEAISAYGLLPADLFGKKSVAPSARKSAAKTKSKHSTVAQYADGKGGEWVGRGPRPKWLREAIAAGKSLSDFAVGSAPKASAPSAKTKRVGAKKTAKSTRASYADGTGKTWSGFGRQPEWLKALLAAGKSLEQLRA